MKKNLRVVLSMVLALVMVLSMAACSNDNPPDTTPDTTPGTTAGTTPATTEATEPSEPETTAGTEPSTEETTSPDMDPDDTLPAEPDQDATTPSEESTTPPETEPVETDPVETAPPETEPVETEPVVTWTAVDQTVYATQTVNVRSDPGTGYGKIGSLNRGESVKRTAIGSNGWSKVEYKGQVAYVYSGYLSTTKPAEETQPKETEPKETEPKETEPAATQPTETQPTETEPQVTWTEVNETVYGAMNVSLCETPSRFDAVLYVDRGTELTRIAIGSNGWSKVKYNGVVYYAANHQLTYEPMTEEERQELEDAKNGIVYCSKCGKRCGEGSDGTCRRQLTVDWTCPLCDTFVLCGECHTCPEE